MKAADFRTQSSNLVSNPSTGVVSVFADASGRLISIDPNGIANVVGTVFSGTIGGAVVTGTNNLVNPKLGGGSGIVYGASGTLLGNPSAFIPCLGPNNEKYAIPVYLWT